MSEQLRPQVHGELVQETVKAAHRDLDRVKELVESEPSLANAVYDRGAGDWETALGGASHMGQTDIAEYLLSKGARIDAFCAATLGKMNILKALIEDDPEINALAWSAVIRMPSVVLSLRRLLNSVPRSQLDFRYVFGADGFHRPQPAAENRDRYDDLNRETCPPDFGGTTVRSAQNES